MIRIQRLSRSEFVRFSAARAPRTHGKYFSLAQSPLPTLAKGVYFACVVSKKVAPNAVRRNRIRRLAREAVRGADLRIDGAFALVMHAKIAAREASSREIAEDIQMLLQKSDSK